MVDWAEQKLMHDSTVILLVSVYVAPVSVRAPVLSLYTTVREIAFVDN